MDLFTIIATQLTPVLSQYEEAIEDCKKLIALEPDNESHQKDLNSLEEIFRLNQRYKNLKE